MSTPYEPLDMVDEILELLRSDATLADVIRISDLDGAPNVDPPMAIIGPPTWTYANPTGGGKAEYTLTVYVVEAQEENALRNLLRHTAMVQRVLDGPDGISVKGASPTAFPSGTEELPAYAIDLGVTA